MLRKVARLSFFYFCQWNQFSLFFVNLHTIIVCLAKEKAVEILD